MNPRPISPRAYRQRMRDVHASLTTDGPVLITSRAGTVALVMAPPPPGFVVEVVPEKRRKRAKGEG